MKKLLILLVVIFILPIGFAQEDVAAGVGPESPFYGLDLFFEKIQLDLAGDGIHKAELHLKFAYERIYEIKEANQEQARERAMELYDEGMTNAILAIKTARTAGQDVSEVIANMNVSVTKHVEVLETVSEKVPEEAKLAIDSGISRSKERIKSLEAKAEETGKGITAKSTVTVGNVVKEISKGYEQLNPAYETAGKNTSS